MRGKGYASMSPLARLMASVVETDGFLDTPCWVSSYGLNANGYTRVTVADRRIMGHRVTYEHFVGPIPEGLEIDHLCRVRGCVNPAHLEPVTAAENTLRSMAPGCISWRTGICKSGQHSMNDAYTDPKRGGRRCRECRRAYDRAASLSRKSSKQKDN